LLAHDEAGLCFVPALQDRARAERAVGDPQVPGSAAPRCPRSGAKRFSLAGRWLPSSTRSRQPGKIAPPSTAAATGARRSALPRTRARRMPGSVRLTLSCSAVSDTPGVSSLRAAACSDGRKPSDTSVISSTTVENSNSRGYCRCRCAANTASILLDALASGPLDALASGPLDALASGHPAGNACSSAVRTITLAGACRSNRSTTDVHMRPLPLARQIRTRHLGPARTS